MAQSLGSYAKFGVEVQLSREVGWATVRDKIIYRELDAAHAPAGMIFAATAGLGSIPVECVTGLVMNLHGNAITLSKKLWESGVRDGATLRAEVQKRGKERRLAFGVVYLFSSHHFLLLNWLRTNGINPEQDVYIVVVPPPQMFPNLKAGHLDGYCSGDPYNSMAVAAGAGWVVATSEELSPMHAEKTLMVRRDFADCRAEEHLALIGALIEACRFCDEPENREQVMDTLARPEFLNIPIKTLRMSFAGTFDYGNGRVKPAPNFNIFSRYGANEPTRAKAASLLGQMRRSGMLENPDALLGSERLFRPDIYQKAVALVPSASES